MISGFKHIGIEPMRLIKALFVVLIALLAITFTCLNAQAVIVNYYIGTTSTPLSLLLAFTLIIGSFFGVLAMFSLFLRQKTHNLRLSHRLKLVEKELANLRALPLQEKE